LGRVDYLTLTNQELFKKIDKYDVVVCGLGLNFNSDILSKAKNLKFLVTATTGLDHIDLKFAEEKGIKVLSLRGEEDFLNTITGTAELALGLLISCSRHIPSSIQSVLKGEWNREKFKGHSLNGKTLGIVGLGRLGKWMARYGEALGMKVIFVDPKVELSNQNWKKVSLNELLKQSDFISIHIHLSPENEYLFNKKTMGMMKKTAYLINTSRGKIVHEGDLIKLIKQKKIAGYTTDVLDGEILFTKNNCKNHPLVRFAKENPNVIIAPHTGGMTHESRRDTDIFIANKLKKYQ
jgi:D-3-phosphoglycerate dehydrogenase